MHQCQLIVPTAMIMEITFADHWECLFEASSLEDSGPFQWPRWR